jgi:hypothetical protein
MKNNLISRAAVLRSIVGTAPHIDAVESVIDYRVAVDKFTLLAEFDDSVAVARTFKL